MKYLSKRDEFIKKSIDKINEYKSYDDLEPINEEIESGPFANDIPWGNSLVGRLVNRIVRNAKKGADLVRIKSVIRKLQDAMDDILDGPAQSALNSEENKEELHRFITFSFIASLEKAVNDEEDIKIIINLTKEAIEKIKNYEDVDNKDSLISQLEEFLKFLEGLKDDKGEEPKKEEENSEDTGVKEEFYQNSIKLLKSTISICDVIKNKKITYDKPAANKQAATNQQPAQKTQQPAKEVVAESSFYENESLPIFESKLEANETKVINAWMKVEKAYANSGIGSMVARMQDLIKNSESGENMELYKKTISKIGYQVISNEQTIGKNMLSLDTLVKEELNPDSENDIPKAISLLGNVILAFKGDLGLASQLIEANQPIKDFIASYDKLKELLPKLKTSQEVVKKENKEEVKKESKLLRYNKFVSINEADEENAEETEKTEDKKSEEISDPVVMTTSQKIKDYWSKKIDVKAFTMERTEVNKIENKFDKIAKEQDKEKFWIYSIDPIIEIVKCFNRAYKLHTTPVIPNVGTTDGRVSASTFAQYTPFGGGNKMNAGLSGGPYRNNAIFDQWENAVLDIIKGTKYQKIFRKEVVIKTKDGNEIPNAGANLRKFMTDMLNGDSLYKSDGQGRQAKFLDEYFGWKGNEKLTFGNDGDYNSKTADQIKTKNLSFTNIPIKFEKNEDLKNSFFAVSTNDKKQLYFYIQDLQNGNLYISYSRSMFFFNRYIEVGAQISTKLVKGDLPYGVNKSQKNEEGKDYAIYAFKIKPESLIGKDGKFLLNGKYDISPVIKYEEGKNKAPKSKLADKLEINIKSMFTLKETIEEEGKDVNKRFILEKVGNSISTYGGFTNIVASSDIENTRIDRK